MSRKYKQGVFVPKNPQKYKGNVNNIIYRSSWEQIAFRFCDQTTDVIWWQSEETVIEYISPVDNNSHRYYMDITMCVRQASGKEQVFMVEIKPKEQTVFPQRKRKKELTFLKEVETYSINAAKWNAAKKVCERHGYKFLIWTQDHLLPKKPARLKRFKKPVDKRK